jgi:hypothetical protein
MDWQGGIFDWGLVRCGSGRDPMVADDERYREESYNLQES